MLVMAMATFQNIILSVFLYSSVHLSISSVLGSLSVHLSACPYVYQSSVCLPLCLSRSPLVCMEFCQSVHKSVYPLLTCHHIYHTHYQHPSKCSLHHYTQNCCRKVSIHTLQICSATPQVFTTCMWSIQDIIPHTTQYRHHFLFHRLIGSEVRTANAQTIT